MAFWYKNSDGLGISPENSEVDIVEDWELEDVARQTNPYFLLHAYHCKGRACAALWRHEELLGS